MSRSGWCHIVAVVGLATIFLNSEQKTKASQDNASANLQYAAFPVISAPTFKPINSLKYQRPCREPQDHDACDLEAQWKAAASASEAAYWGKISAVIGFFGTIGLVLNLYYTRQAVFVADRAVKDNRKLGQAQVRAYVKYELFGITLVNAVNAVKENLCSLIIDGNAINSGQTPAKNISVRFCITTASTKDGFLGISDLEMKSFPAASGVIGGGESRHQRLQDTFKIDYALLSTGRQHIRLSGILEYDDIFDEKRHTEFDGFIDNIGPYIAFEDAKSAGKTATNANETKIAFEWVKY